MAETIVNVRYIIDDVPAAIAFYIEHLGFTLETDASPAFAMMARGALRLALSGPKSSGARAMPTGDKPAPGGWNRIQLVTNDLAGDVARLRAAGVTFQNDIISGPGGLQILLRDPSGNAIELFQPMQRP